MSHTPEGRKLVKARLVPHLHEQLTTYARETHRSVSSAVEHLIAIGLDVERGRGRPPGGTSPDPDPIHTR